MIKTYLNIKKKIKTYIKYIESIFNKNDIMINTQLFEFVENETDLNNYSESDSNNIEGLKELLCFYKKLKESDDLINDCLILLNHLLYINKRTYFYINEVILEKYKSNIVNYKIACLITIIFGEYFNIESNKLINQKNIELIVYKNMNELMKNANANANANKIINSNNK